MSTQPIGIIVAMDAELVHLTAWTGGETVRAGVWTDVRFTVGDLPVIATRCGIGMVAAAAATERSIDTYRPAALLNFGCTGAHRRDLLPGDVIIGTACVNHARLKILPDGSEQYDFDGYHIASDSLIASDSTLIQQTEAAARGWEPEMWPVGKPPRPPQVLEGVVASADIWTQSPARIDMLHERHGSLCEDMEAAAIAQIAALHGVPFLTIKDISNNELLVATTFEGDNANFPLAETGKRAAALTYRLLVSLAGGS